MGKWILNWIEKVPSRILEGLVVEGHRRERKASEEYCWRSCCGETYMAVADALGDLLEDVPCEPECLEECLNKGK